MAKSKLPNGIRMKGSSYEARAMINGIRIQLSGKDLNALVIAFDEAKNQARQSIDYKKSSITLNEWFEEWFSQVKEHKIKETSIYPMKSRFIRTFGFYIGNQKIKDIKPLDVQQAINAMEKSGVANSTMRDVLGRLRECLEYAVANQLISCNPTVVVEVPWEYKRAEEEIALTQQEQNRLLNEVEGSWYKEMFYFLCLTGVRVGELGALKWDDIDFDNKTICINHSLSCSYCNGVKKEMIVSPKTVNSIRKIPFIGEMEEILKSQKTKQRKLKVDLGERWRSQGEFENLVFTTGMGSPCSRYIVQKEIKKVVKRMREREAIAAVNENRKPIEIRDFHPHTLRHTFATRCFEKKMEPKVVQKLLGHSNISITLNIYTHVLEEKMDNELKKFGAAKTEPLPSNVVTVPRITAMSHV